MIAMRRTLAVRVCSPCRKFLGLSLWPWSGGWFTATHGMCDDCLDAFELQCDAQEQIDAAA